MSSTKHHTASPWHGRTSSAFATSRPLTDADRTARAPLLRSLPTSTGLEGTEAANDQPHTTPDMAALAGHTTPTATQRRSAASSNSAVWRLRYRAGYRAGWRAGLLQRAALACCAFAAGMGTAAALVKLGTLNLL